MKDLTKKERFIVECELGYINAEWVNGRKFPECWGSSRCCAISYTRKRAEMLAELAEDNNLKPKIIQIL